MLETPGDILNGATLSRADLADRAGRPHALVDCTLEEADLGGLDLAGWRFEKCDLRRCDLAGARLERTLWQSCRGGFANFLGSDLAEARFIASDFNNACFRRSSVQAASFVRCKLTGADLSELRALDVTFEETILIGAKLPDHAFRNARLVQLDLAQADLRRCDFRGTAFDQCSLRDALVDGARFEGADLRGADLGGVRLGDANRFRGATISRDQAGQLLREVGLNVR